MNPEARFVVTGALLQIILELARETKDAKVRVTAGMRLKAGLIVESQKPPASDPKCALAPNEVCMFCGHTGEAKKKRSKKAKPTCQDCKQPFTRETPWRNFRGKRRHEACIQAANNAVMQDQDQ